ncbi:Protein ABIL1 [Cucurbita argyrosperma subsp. argyrosperma]|nr:Protein ABIL1 [Cucurbita argyrosperma subsp. argyrosperma]
MELDQLRPDNPAMTFDEASMERSKSFVKALQELKNLRPQLYSAAEYCEKTYLHSEQKQMVVDNLKDYAVRALVNAVDHLGTVAYKLTELLEQQTSDVSTMELKVSCLNQQLLTCQTYTSKEGLRQQQLLALIPRHHKHYILPNSVSKKVHFSPHIQTDARQQPFQARGRLQPSGIWFMFNILLMSWCEQFFISVLGIPASKTLSWHLASETKSTRKGGTHSLNCNEDQKIAEKTSGIFHLIDNDATIRPKYSAGHIQPSNGFPASSAILQTLGGTHREAFEGSKHLTAFRSFDAPNRQERVHVPARSKSVLSAFFVKQKTPKLKAGSVS